MLERLRAGEGNDRGWDYWMASSIHSVDLSLSELQEIEKDREAWCAAVHGGHKESDTTEQLNNNKKLFQFL